MDEVLHGVIEGNPPLSMKKFVRYSLPTLMEKFSKKQKKRRSAGQDSE